MGQKGKKLTDFTFLLYPLISEKKIKNGLTLHKRFK